MKAPWFKEGSIAASGTLISPGDIALVRARTASVTVRLTFGASIDADTTVNVYYSPDGTNWDSIAYTSFTIAYTVSQTKQRSISLNVPEHGYLKISIVNGSSADTLTNIVAWYTVQSWPMSGDIGKGAIYIDTGEEKQIVEKEA